MSWPYIAACRFQLRQCAARGTRHAALTLRRTSREKFFLNGFGSKLGLGLPAAQVPGHSRNPGKVHASLCNRPPLPGRGPPWSFGACPHAAIGTTSLSSCAPSPGTEGNVSWLNTDVSSFASSAVRARLNSTSRACRSASLGRPRPRQRERSKRNMPRDEMRWGPYVETPSKFGSARIAST